VKPAAPTLDPFRGPCDRRTPRLSASGRSFLQTLLIHDAPSGDCVQSSALWLNSMPLDCSRCRAPVPFYLIAFVCAPAGEEPMGSDPCTLRIIRHSPFGARTEIRKIASSAASASRRRPQGPAILKPETNDARCLSRSRGSFTMRLILTSLVASAALAMIDVRPGAAQYAAQLYPYCSLSSSSGATNCYVRSREECGHSGCISNPWYIGRMRARPYLEGRRPLQPHYVRP
jgi:hypothetical protein